MTDGDILLMDLLLTLKQLECLDYGSNETEAHHKLYILITKNVLSTVYTKENI